MNTESNQVLNVYVMDREGHPIPGARLRVLVNGEAFTTVIVKGLVNSPTQIHIPANLETIELEASYLDAQQTDNVAANSLNHTIKLDVLMSDNAIAPVGSVPTWFTVAGLAGGAVTLFFLMALVLLSVFGFEIPRTSRFILIAVLALGVAISAAFLGGSAAASGKIPLPGNATPIQFTIAGGVAVFVIVLLLGAWLYPSDDEKPSIIAIDCPVNYQSHQVASLGFAFCWPRTEWELDAAALDANAADLFVRWTQNRDVSLQFHVSKVPPAYVQQHQDLSRRL
jgi:hypothetical protein